VKSDEIRMNRVPLNASTMPVRLGPQLLNVLLAFLLSACAGSPHPRLVSPSEGPPTQRYLELYRDKQIATLHFPAGVYTLDAVDKIGYYYRAPRKIAEAGSVWRDGGIFVSKRDPHKLRGYVWRAGAITHIGNLSHAKHRLFDQDVPAEFYR
jgi:hypothetical protein